MIFIHYIILVFLLILLISKCNANYVIIIYSINLPHLTSIVLLNIHMGVGFLLFLECELEF